jgi:hypothetical protein
MGSVPLPALDVRTQQVNPLDEFARIFQLRGLQQSQQIQQAQLQGINTENQTRQLALQEGQLTLADDQKWRSAFAREDWDGSPEQLLKNGLKAGVGPKSYAAVAQGLAASGEAYAKLGSEQLKVQQALGDHVADQLQAVQDAPDESKLAVQQQAKKNSIAWVTSTPGLHPVIRQNMLQGIQQIPDDVPLSDDVLQSMIGRNKLHSAMVEEGLKTAQTGEAAGKGAQAQAEADKIRAQSSPTSPLYSPTPQALALGASQGSPTAQAIQTGTAQQAGREAGAKASAELPAEIAKIHAQQGMLGPELANVPPRLVGAATTDATKAGQEFAEAQSAAADMKTFVDMAKAGNKIAYAYSPTEGVLTLNTGRGVRRVNMAEISSYCGAGSLADRVTGFFGKQLSGSSIPDDVLNDMAALHGAIADNAGKLYGNKLAVINSAYHSNFKPVTLGQSGARQAAGAVKAAARTPKADHRQERRTKF